MKCFILLVALVVVVALAQPGDAGMRDTITNAGKSAWNSVRNRNKGNNMKGQQPQKQGMLSRMTSRIPGLGGSQSKTPGSGASGRMTIPGFGGKGPSVQASVQGPQGPR